MKLYYGVAYYPELWDSEQIDKDIVLMRDIGINTVRIGEFAWGTMERKEGVFDFSFFKTVLDKMYAADISVIMCTPTCTPPKWLTDKYPDTLIENDLGVKRQFGGRCHACKNSKNMREKTAIVVTEECKALASHPAIIGWQIDNEIYPYDNGCFCKECKKKFTEYIADKYGTVENLNRIWGTARWSLEYDSFGDVIPPRKDTWNHPSLQADWLAFQSQSVVDFVAFQADIIKKYSDKPIGTDMMTAPAVDYSDMNECLDVVQINHYEKECDFYFQTFWFDRVRTVKSRPFWCTETQTCWNGAFQADFGAKQITNCYANTFMPFFKGGEMNLYWLWRTHPCGHELMHGAVIDAAGREYYTTPQVRRAIKDLNACKDVLCSSKIKSDIALHYSSDCFRQFSYVPVTENFNYQKSIYNVYRGFMHTNIDVIDEKRSLDGYKTLISPFLCRIDNESKDKILDFVKNGGRWIVGPMTDIFDFGLRKFTDAPFGFLEKVAGVTLKYNVPVDHNDYKAEYVGGEKLEISGYYDGYIPRTANSLAEYSEGDFKGLSVITEASYGKGKIILVGSVIDGKEYAKLALAENYFDCSDNICINKRTDDVSGKEYFSLIECFGKDGYATLNGTYKNVIDGKSYNGKISFAPFDAVLLCKE